MAVTGPKTDTWLVKTVSVLLFPYSIICFWKALDLPVTTIIILLMVVMSLSLSVVELYYYFTKTIKWVYAVDALLQILFSYWWINYWYKHLKTINHE